MKMLTLDLYKPKEVKFKLQNLNLQAQGVLGIVNFDLSFLVRQMPDKKLYVEKKNIAILKNVLKKIIYSVTIGWYMELNLNGIGFKVFRWKDKIAFDLGYSVLLWYSPPKDVKIQIFKNKLVFFSMYRELLNKVCYTLQNYAYPDVYKGKGLLFKNQIIKLKKKSKI